MAAANVTDEVGVANLALQRCGAAQITVLDDTTRNGKAANLIFADTRDLVCKLFPWSCLITRTVLSTSAATNSEFGFAHTLAAGDLTVLDVNGTKLFRVEGGEIFTNDETGYYRHTAVDATLANWDVHLLQSIALKIAAELAVKLSADIQLSALLYQEWIMSLSTAIRLRAIESSEDNKEILALLQEFSPAILLKNNYPLET